MCSGSLTPDWDFGGKQLEDLLYLNRYLNQISITSFYGGDYGVIVFCWLPVSDKYCKLLVKSLLNTPEINITNRLIRFFFEYFENLCINPKWWDNLSVPQRQSLLHRFNVSANPMNYRSSSCLLDNSLAFDPWDLFEIVEKY